MSTNVKIEGAGPPIVLIHGLGLDLTIWDGLVDYLVGEHTVIRYDLLGHGASPAVHDVTLEAFDRQILEVLEKAKVTSATFVGLSLGGVIARSFAARHPEHVDALVLLNTISRRTSEQRANVAVRAEQLAAGDIDAVTDAAITRWFSDDFQKEQPGIVQDVRERMLRNDPASYLACYRLFARAHDEIVPLHGKIPAPTLVVTGEQDVGSTPDMALEIAEEMLSARPVILPELRHLAILEDPEAVHRTMAGFLGRRSLGDQRAGGLT